jgi:hypothetical protein
MLWFALGVIAVAGITLVVFRLWTTHEPRQRLPRRPAPRPYAPDDDEEFLRSLSRKPRE